MTKKEIESRIKEKADIVFLNNQNQPLRCDANGYTWRPMEGMFFSDELNEKWDKKAMDWDNIWKFK